MDYILNKNRYIALIITIFLGIVGWYNLILFTSKKYLPIPDSNQYNGLCIVIVLSILYWLRNCYTIKIE